MEIMVQFLFAAVPEPAGIAAKYQLIHRQILLEATTYFDSPPTTKTLRHIFTPHN